MQVSMFSLDIDDATRERVVVLVCALGAIGWGAFAAIAPSELVSASFSIAFFGALAFLLPRAWLGIALAVLIPLQFYFPLTASLYLRGAFVFVVAAAVRVLFGQQSSVVGQLFALSGQQSAVSGQQSPVSGQRSAISGQRSAVLRLPSSSVLRPSSWFLPAVFFLLAAFIAALGATNRYVAFKGIYDWLPIFAAVFVIGETTRGVWRAYIVKVLVIVGVAEALLGWIQTWFTSSQIAEMLQASVSQWFIQPNLVRERLADFSFNWVLGNRVLPFGTFINSIDYALFLAAIGALGIALTADRQPPTVAGDTQYTSRHTLFRSTLSRSALSRSTLYTLPLALIGLVLLQTFKASALLALIGGGAVWLLAYGTRLRASQMVFLVTMGIGLVILLGAISFEPLVQRATFVLQRETLESYETGRLEIWGQLFAALPQRPLFGFGLNNAGSLIAPTQSLHGGTFIAVINSPESAYVAMLVETGIIGFVCLLWFFGATLVRAFQRARDSTLDVGVLAAIVALLCGNLTVSALTTDQNGLLLGVLVGMVYANDGRTDE